MGERVTSSSGIEIFEVIFNIAEPVWIDQISFLKFQKSKCILTKNVGILYNPK
jgi:hypothetical protein